MSLDMTFERRVMACANLFRLGRDIEGGMRMVELTAELAKTLEGLGPEVSVRAPVVLSAMFCAQQRQDWLGLADTLEVELLQLLKHPED
jgi:hypothetical protein